MNELVYLAMVIAICEFVSASNMKNKFNDHPMTDATAEQLGPREPNKILYGRYIDVLLDSGLPCTCTSRRSEWSSSSNCIYSNPARCSKSVQFRTRMCQSKCYRIQAKKCERSALFNAGKWGPWLYNVSFCSIGTMVKATRFCYLSDAKVGPYCNQSNGTSYQERLIPCNNIRQSESKSQMGGWIESHKGNLIVILLAVLAGVFLVALIFVSVMLSSLRKSLHVKAETNRSVSESNVSATSYLSNTPEKSKRSGRGSSFFQQQKGASRHSKIIPDIAFPVTDNGLSVKEIKSPMQHNDSLLLTRKHIPSKRAHGGSFRSDTKSAVDKTKPDRHTGGELFFYESYPLGSSENYEESAQSKLQRRVTDGGNDSVTRESQRSYILKETQIMYGTVDATKLDGSGMPRNKDNGTKSTDDTSHKITQSVHNIKEETKERDQVGPHPEYSENVAKDPKENISQRRQNENHSEYLQERPISVEKSSKTEKTGKQLPEAESQLHRDKDSSNENKRPISSTFLFSPQAYNSLHRSATAAKNAKKGQYKMDVDALMKRVDNASKFDEEPRIKVRRTKKSLLERPVPAVPRTRDGFRSSDLDTYADVWDAKTTEADRSSNGSTYADVWDANYTEKLSMENEEDDYSEVFDDASNAKNVAKARVFARQNVTKEKKEKNTNKIERSANRTFPGHKHLRLTPEDRAHQNYSVRIDDQLMRDLNPPPASVSTNVEEISAEPLYCAI